MARVPCLICNENARSVFASDYMNYLLVVQVFIRVPRLSSERRLTPSLQYTSREGAVVQKAQGNFEGSRRHRRQCR